MAFADKIYELCKLIPKGRVSTYKEIGVALDCSGMIYRAVGNALNKNPYAQKVPCHRVVKADGSIGGFQSGHKNKIKLLRQEGVQIKDDKIVNFQEILHKFKKKKRN